MSQQAFNVALDPNNNSTTIKITSTGSSVATEIPFGPDVMIAVRTSAVWLRWGVKTTTVSDGTAATQGFWLPANFAGRMHKPEGATHLAVIQDTAAAQIYVTPGSGM